MFVLLQLCLILPNISQKVLLTYIFANSVYVSAGCVSTHQHSRKLTRESIWDDLVVGALQMSIFIYPLTHPFICSTDIH